ncbi:hypothetical protein H1P_3580005 [Hyella patelloides LEGE 07179]|uniref:Uncharacterized protein n=1 Tax=Hyella patelloides LEGE 07179 TaxID=945734 RepID=A0A563VW65_9CYAN|nr:hypothetical protein H1P_3580005 [Hyella patelloides LEGE 07179]
MTTTIYLCINIYCQRSISDRGYFILLDREFPICLTTKVRLRELIPIFAHWLDRYHIIFN